MAFLAKLRPMGPWRAGPDTGDRSRAGAVLHSDTLYSALTHAMLQLDLLDPWIAATAANPQGSDVRFSSGFPFCEQTLYVAPPKPHWPPPPSLKIRWKAARFVPVSMASALLQGRALREEDWIVDGVSECLMPAQRPAIPFRPVTRTGAAVDRLGDGAAPYRTACIEFHRDGGLWIAFDFVSPQARSQWEGPLQGALRLLADTGLGGGRSRGWGRFEQPEFQFSKSVPHLLFGRNTPPANGGGEYWLLSLFSPSPLDRVNWKQGAYELAIRNGRVESASAGAWGLGKRTARLIAEGSVLSAEAPLVGAAHDAAPEGFAHPVYRAGFAFALPVGVAPAVENDDAV